MLSPMTIPVRVQTVVFLSFVCFLGIFALVFKVEYQAASVDIRLELEKKTFVSRRPEMLATVESVVNQLSSIEKVVPEPSAFQKLALEHVQELWVSGGTFFWISDRAGRMIFYPPNPEYQGQVVPVGFTSTGRNVYVEAAAQGQGAFPIYVSQSEDSPIAGLTVFKTFEPMGWVVGQTSLLSTLPQVFIPLSRVCKNSLVLLFPCVLVLLAVVVFCIRFLVTRPLMSLLGLTDSGVVSLVVQAERQASKQAKAEIVKAFENAQAFAETLVHKTAQEAFENGLADVQKAQAMITGLKMMLSAIRGEAKNRYKRNLRLLALCRHQKGKAGHEEQKEGLALLAEVKREGQDFASTLRAIEKRIAAIDKLVVNFASSVETLHASVTEVQKVSRDLGEASMATSSKIVNFGLAEHNERIKKVLRSRSKVA